MTNQTKLENQERHCIWFAGDTNALLKKILDVVQNLRKDSVRVDPAPYVLFELLWNETRFSVRHDSELGLIIAMPDDVSDEIQWQNGLQEFYHQVVRPLADKTGGITVGLSPTENQTWADHLKESFEES